MSLASLNFLFRADTENFERKLRQSKKSVNAFDSGIKALGGAVAGAFSVGAVLSLGKSIIDVRGEFEKYEAVLRTTLGSSDDAASSMAMLQNFAAKTPFQLGGLTDSYVKLVNRE